MRSIGWYLLSLVSLSALALPAHALLIEFCVPDCASGDIYAVQSAPEQTSTDPSSGVTTTTVPIASFVHHGFTIAATVSSQQSGNLQKITFDPTTITANSDAGCTGDTSNPCLMQIVATSDPCDFPLMKPVGGYPAGAYMMGSFAGPQTAGNGDTVAMTGESSGLTPAVGQCSDPATRPPAADPVNTDVINAAPPTDPGNIGESLPSLCTGNPSCKFKAAMFRKGFSTQIMETVQQVCAGTDTSCLTRLQTSVNVEIKTAGNSMSLPLEHVTTNPDPAPDPAQKKNPVIELLQNLAPPFAALDVGSLSIGLNDVRLTATLRLSSGSAIDPAGEETFFSVGPFSTTIPPNMFKQLLPGDFTFVGTVDGRDVTANFVRSALDPNEWTFSAAVQNVQLQGIPALQPPLPVPVQIGVGTDTGKGLATALFL